MHYLKALEECKNFGKEINKSLDLPIKIKYSSPIEIIQKSKFCAVIILEQHKSNAYQGINYSRTNINLLKYILGLDQIFEFKFGIKEGISEIKAHEKLINKGLDELLQMQYGLTEILANKTQIQWKVAEKEDDFINFMLWGYLCNSLSKNPNLIEQKRLEELAVNLDANKIYSLSQNIIKKIGQENLIIDSQTKLIKATMTANPEKLMPSCLQALDLYLLKRDENLSAGFLALDAGIHLIVVGELHQKNLVSSLEKQGIGSIVLSAFLD